MAKDTLLEIVQEILSDTKSDEVNSITDTAEAEAVARIVISTFEAMVSNRNWAHTRELVDLVGFGDNDRPTHVTVPDEVSELLSLNYNNEKENDARLYFEPVLWKEPDDFLRWTNRNNSTSATVKTVIDPSGVKLLIRNDIHPSYFTSFNDDTLVMDSYDSAVHTTIHQDQIQAHAHVIPQATFSDVWTPDLPLEAFSALKEEAKSVCQLRLKSFQDQKAEQISTRQQRWLSRKNWRMGGGLKYPNFGRKGKRRKDATFRSSHD